MAFKIIAAILFGALVGLDRHIAGKPVALAQNILVSLFGLFIGDVWLAIHTRSGGSLDSEAKSWRAWACSRWCSVS